MKNINRPNYYRKEITIFVEKKKKGMIDQATIDRIMAATDIVEVVSDFVSLRREALIIGGCVRFMMIKPLRSEYINPKAFVNVSVAAKEVVLSISLWNMSNYRITKR